MANRFKFFIFLVFVANLVFAQSRVQTVQPKIMVVPKILEGEDYRVVLEADPYKRIVLAKIKEAFDARGCTTVDFEAKLRAVSQNSVFQENSQTDLKKQLIDNSGADIYVEAEILLHGSSEGNSVKVILQAYEVSSANSLANKIADSGEFYTNDVGKLAMKAINRVADDFLNVMQSKFNDIAVNGRSIVVKFSFNVGSAFNMSTPMGGGDLLSDLICDWMEDHAYKNNCHFEGVTDTGLTFDDYRIPIIDEVSGRNYNIRHFTRELRNYLGSLGLSISQDMKGQTLFVTIN